MSLSQQNNNQDPGLQGSWVELEMNGNTLTLPPPATDPESGDEGGAPTPRSPESLPVEVEESLGGGLKHVPSSSSVHHGDMEDILLDAQHESSLSSCDSPDRTSSPDQVTFDAELRRASQEDCQGTDGVLMSKAADCAAPWSSRPENSPPKELQFRRPRRALSLSVRKTGVMKSGGFFSADFLRVFLPSLLVSHLLALGLGVYIGKRFTTPPTNSF